MLSFVKQLALDSAKIFFSTPTDIVRKKAGVGNFVTKADLEIERFIKSQISAKYPAHTIIAEESDYPYLKDNNTDIWFIDPLDGTTAAKFGYPSFAVSIAYMRNQIIEIGVIYDLYKNELFWAKRGHGAFKGGGQRLKITEAGLANGAAATCAPYRHADFILESKIIDRLFATQTKVIMTGCAAVNCALVAAGNVTVYFNEAVKSWDVAAGSLLVEEAGGVVSSYRGKLDFFHPDPFICGSKTAVQEFREMLKTISFRQAEKQSSPASPTQ